MKKLKLLFCSALAALGLSSQASAAGIDLYNSHEFDLDIFGTRAFSGSDSDRLLDEDANGGGLALTYFLTEMIGFGGEATLLETRGDTTAITSATTTFRMPFGDSGLSVQGLVGLGVIWNPNDFQEDGDSEDSLFVAHAGVGAEWRMSETFGVFADWRYNFVDRGESDYGQARLGMRFAW